MRALVTTTMNLGQIYFQTFVVLLVTPTIASMLVLCLFRRKLSSYFSMLALLSIFLGPSVGVGLNYKYHRIVFSSWHQSQNQFVPSSGCITYDPEFSRLYATYKMTLPQFHQWAAMHPWKLSALSPEVFNYDLEIMEFDTPEAIYATEMEPNGKQLRVYFKSETMYLSYNSM